MAYKYGCMQWYEGPYHVGYDERGNTNKPFVPVVPPAWYGHEVIQN